MKSAKIKHFVKINLGTEKVVKNKNVTGQDTFRGKKKKIRQIK